MTTVPLPVPLLPLHQPEQQQQTKKRSGRKMIDTPAASKRTAQKREASRAFRERSANYIRELEEKARSVGEHGDKDSEIEALKNRIAALESENVLLRQTSFAFNAPFDFSTVPVSTNPPFVVSPTATALLDPLSGSLTEPIFLGEGDSGALNRTSSAVPSLPLFGLLPQLSSPSASPPSQSTSASTTDVQKALDTASLMSLFDGTAALFPSQSGIDTVQLISDINSFRSPAALNSSTSKAADILSTADDHVPSKAEILSVTAEDFSLEAWLFSGDDEVDPPIKKEDACRIVAGTVVSLKDSLKPEVVDELCTLITNKCGCRDD
ncbi:hypothetical protein HDU84_005271 [Entophlyctis sp. JEL0112]|nr:hypothetical protein HDU84_005271 [Entophlyctis sp. JEL0112]